MQICTLTQTHNHASIPPLNFFYRPDAIPATQPIAPKPKYFLLISMTMFTVKMFFAYLLILSVNAVNILLSF